MAISTTLTAVLVVAAILIVKNGVARYRYNSKFKLPPEIPGWPIIGNTLDVPFPAGVWGHEMAKKHGEMVSPLEMPACYSWAMIVGGEASAETKFIPFEELEVRHLVWDYLHTPDQFYTANQRFSNSVIMSVIFGRRAQLGHEQLTKMLKLMAEFGQLLFSPTKNICDLFPWIVGPPSCMYPISTRSPEAQPGWDWSGSSSPSSWLGDGDG
ncbi:hypothetical protein B0J13DRAFT_632694 [Dactylonectria estremocensis]|uniref:O-methylsterigmatocystin oxidoreductase n=1 Tax=Dactylonectria estremocensis TaxID=1079267 RepID=A0A9P9FI90_9HYPO|nr:hypothetical protein B0J13DRAFT_632694 [Dactylonectria estremocensis]